ncbi:MAG: sigma-70 family RNA polymerase sigma factor [Verrucomicrobiales bacterium]|nr:sigma-70 family RNA polymerase sigma factor [Verrucomicrobiales bacterium]
MKREAEILKDLRFCPEFILEWIISMSSKREDRKLGDRLQTRLSLIESLKRKDPASWKEFSSLYGGIVHGFAMKLGCTHDEAQEVVQETLISVSKDISRFDTDPDQGSFGVWLLTIARRRAVDQMRKRPPQGRFVDMGGPGTGTPPVSRIPEREADLSAVWETEWRQALLDKSIESLKTQVNPVHFKIYYLAVIKEKPASEVAKALRVSAAQVYLVKHRLGLQLRREMKKLQDREPS